MAKANEEESVCEHCANEAPKRRRFCSKECARCERESDGETGGCDGLCLGVIEKSLGVVGIGGRLGGVVDEHAAIFIGKRHAVAVFGPDREVVARRIARALREVVK